MRQIKEGKLEEVLLTIADEIVALKEDKCGNAGHIWYQSFEHEFIDRV